MSKTIIEKDWFKRFFSFGNNIGSGKIVDPRESMVYFEDVQHQMNFMFVLLHALSKTSQSAQISGQSNIKEDLVLELNQTG